MVKDNVEYFFKTFSKLINDDNISQEDEKRMMENIHLTILSIYLSEVTLDDIVNKMLIYSKYDMATSIVGFNFLIKSLVNCE